MSEETAVTPTPAPQNRLFSFLGSEVFIGSLVAILSILTAIAAYQGWRQEDISGDAEVKAIRALTESNTEYISANQEIIFDYQVFDSYYLSDLDSEAEQYYLDSFSDALDSSLDRPDGPFDDPYYEEMYLDADALYDEAITQFDRAEAAGELADGYQITMLIYAVGLSLAAWGSLADEGNRMRILFGILSTVALCFGTYLWIGVTAVG